jgi:GT2 family glycosyltransferase
MLLGESLGRGAANAEFEYGRQSPGTGNLLVHRGVFERVGLFDETLTTAGEDTDLYSRVHRAGIAAWYTPLAVVFHQIPEDRMTARSLQWSARRIGSHVARRDRREQGAWFGPVAAMRVGYGLARTAALQLKAQFRRDHWTRINAGCRWAFTRGYLRGTLAELAPKWFAGGRFFDQLSFRHKGETPAAPSTGAA